MNILGFEKLLYHSDKVEKLKNNEPQFPVHATISLGNHCNHKCLWCTAYEYQAEKADFLDKELFTKFLREASKHGLKAITYVGNGEPTAYPGFGELVKDVAALGIEQAMFTNGYLLDRYEDEIIKHFTWLRISIDAGSTAVHNKMHDVTDHYDRIMSNIKSIASKRNGHAPTLGVQYAVHHENIDDMYSAAKQCRDAGADYFSIKPVFTRGAVGERIERNKLTLKDIEPVVEKMMHDLNSESYSIFFRPFQFLAHEKEASIFNYDRCIAGFFNVSIYEDNNIIYCGPHRISVGKITDDIESVKQRIVELSTNLDLTRCPAGCRYHGLNKLWDAIVKPEKFSSIDHRNFI